MEKLKEIRKIRKISQKEFAEEMNVAQNTVSRWENGERLMDSDTLIKAANFFNVSADYLLGRADETFKNPPPQKNDENIKIINEYAKLNDIGKQEAIKRVSELSLIPHYCNVKKDMPIAAHNDAVIDKKELELMREDIDEL